MPNSYTGIGSRETPEGILKLMKTIARLYSQMGWTLRSGGAKGADTAFEEGSGDLKEIYTTSIEQEVDRFVYDKAQRLSAMYHPAWTRLPAYVKRLHARNAFQVLGPTLDTPSNMVICWTPDGCIDHYARNLGTGGTGTAISIAFYAKVPIINLARADHMWSMQHFISEYTKKEATND